MNGSDSKADRARSKVKSQQHSRRVAVRQEPAGGASNAAADGNDHQNVGTGGQSEPVAHAQACPSCYRSARLVEAPQMKKIAANIQIGLFPQSRWETSGGRPLNSLAMFVHREHGRTRTTAKAATSVAAAPALKTKRQPSTSVARDARRRPAAEPRNWVDVKRPKVVAQ